MSNRNVRPADREDLTEQLALRMALGIRRKMDAAAGGWTRVADRMGMSVAELRSRLQDTKEPLSLWGLALKTCFLFKKIQDLRSDSISQFDGFEGSVELCDQGSGSSWGLEKVSDTEWSEFLIWVSTSVLPLSR